MNLFNLGYPTLYIHYVYANIPAKIRNPEYFLALKDVESSHTLFFTSSFLYCNAILC